ncbi:MAG TPA: CpaD family pilus assembly protein [Rhizomicrobium sp.]|jgi:pilus assembly protein CpaD|nr:CpaD family pilus assembly protein [Rhizomicrobium sp.]
MMPSAKDFLRVASLLAVLAAGSCAAPINTVHNNGGLVDDPDVNHPIAVEPNMHKLRVSFSSSDAGLMPDDAAHFDAFVQDYMQHGNGAISISVPAGSDSRGAIAYFGERLAAFGVPRDRILVGTSDSRDGRVELGYIGYVATTSTCGDWSDDLGHDAANRVSPNFGCATQHNITAQIADPRDLVTPQPTGPGDAARRSTVYNNYKDGKPTGATMTSDQSAAVADVNK